MRSDYLPLIKRRPRRHEARRLRSAFREYGGLHRCDQLPRGLPPSSRCSCWAYHQNESRPLVGGRKSFVLHTGGGRTRTSNFLTKSQCFAALIGIASQILFAKNQAHADFIAERFNLNYPHDRGEFARVITFKTEYAQNLINDFAIKANAPYLALSVDMLDTGIDVPEVVNLVFFKRVRSKTKFWQMVGRVTRFARTCLHPGSTRSSSTSSTIARTSSTSAKNPKRRTGRLVPRSGSVCSPRGLSCLLSLISPPPAKPRQEPSRSF